MSLPLQAVEHIMERLTLAYGRHFTDIYAQVDPQGVKAAWGFELGAFDNEIGMQRIAWALDNLPDRAPNVLQFKTHCRQAPAPAVPQLPEPAANPERMRAELAKLGHVSVKARAPSGSSWDHKAWAKLILARDKAGEKLNAYTLKCAQDAMRVGKGLESA